MGQKPPKRSAYRINKINKAVSQATSIRFGFEFCCRLNIHIYITSGNNPFFGQNCGPFGYTTGAYKSIISCSFIKHKYFHIIFDIIFINTQLLLFEIGTGKVYSPTLYESNCYTVLGSTFFNSNKIFTLLPNTQLRPSISE